MTDLDQSPTPPWCVYEGAYEHSGEAYKWSCYATAPVLGIRLLAHGMGERRPGLEWRRFGEMYALIMPSREPHFAGSQIEAPPGLWPRSIGAAFTAAQQDPEG